MSVREIGKSLLYNWWQVSQAERSRAKRFLFTFRHTMQGRNKMEAEQSSKKLLRNVWRTKTQQKQNRAERSSFVMACAECKQNEADQKQNGPTQRNFKVAFCGIRAGLGLE